MISAILLAAGESRRMLEFKQLLSFEGKTFVQCCADNLLASGIGELIVVTGHRQEDVRLSLKDRQVRFAHNPDYLTGMSSSIKRGIQSISKDAEAVLIALSDQPQIGSEIILHLLDAFRRQRPLIIVPTYNGRNGHPVILDIRLKEEVLSIDPDQGLRQVVHAHANEVVKIEAAGEEVIFDFDLPEDYRLRGKP